MRSLTIVVLVLMLVPIGTVAFSAVTLGVNSGILLHRKPPHTRPTRVLPSVCSATSSEASLAPSSSTSRPSPSATSHPKLSLSRLQLVRLLPAVVAAGVSGSALLASSAPAAAAIPRALQELTDECETDACITKSRRVFKRVGRKFEITQEFGSAQSRSTGSAVWEGDVVLTKYMETEVPPEYWKGKNVLELGAGTGFASFVAALLGARCVITDGDTRVLQLARANAAANLSPMEQELLEYKELKWELAADSAWQYMPKPDVILAADVTYYPKNIPPLTRMIQRLARDDTEIFLAHTIRPTDKGSMESFKKFFKVETIRSGPVFDGHSDTFIYRMLPLSGAGDGGAVEGDTNKNDGCNAGYVKNKAVNLCVPATSTPQ